MVEPGGGLARGQRLAPDQRRLLVGICVVIGAVAVVPATYNFVLNPMLQGLGGTESEQSLLRELPSIAALLVIFLAATLGGRIGERRLIIGCSVLFTSGCTIVTVAPVLLVATIGLVMLSAASSAMAVVSLGLLSARVVDPKARATAFATFAIVGPLIYMATPVIAGATLDNWSWRFVPALWTLGGVVMIWAAWALLPKDVRTGHRAQLLTPALAGLVLAAVVQTIMAISQDGWVSTATLIRASAAVGSSVALVWCYQRMSRVSLSLTVLQSGGMLILLVVVIVVPFVNLWFYMTIGYESVYGMTALQTAMLMVPAQLAGVGGAMVARRTLHVRGITFTGVIMLGALSGSLLTSLLITVVSPLWLLVSIMSFYAAASVGASVPVTNSIMNAAPVGEEGSASAFRGAAMHVGTALGVVVMSTVVYTVIAGSLGNSLESEGLESQESAQIAQSLRAGATSQDASASYAVPINEVDEIDQAQKYAMVDGLHAFGISGALLIATAAGIFWFGRRRQTRGVLTKASRPTTII